MKSLIVTHRLSRAVLSFIIVGGIGFVIDAGLLMFFTLVTGWSPWQARIPSFSAAVLTTWLLNRRYTFAGRRFQRASSEALAYGIIQSVGAGINLFVFGACLNLMPGTVSMPLIPFTIGAAVALLFNFAASKTFVYGSARPDHEA